EGNYLANNFVHSYTIIYVHFYIDIYIYNNVQVGVGPQQREFGFPISTDNASWRGPNIEAGGKSVYNNVQVGVGRRNKFCENIISVPLPSKE
ncbi:hypothetical protein LMP56_01675, partial [Staphylococcus aureus]|uniref:hypothetical protein n=1 Tax=Staphylococcus aureus TaxID=1280 RepID=UPI001E3F936F